MQKGSTTDNDSIEESFISDKITEEQIDNELGVISGIRYRGLQCPKCKALNKVANDSCRICDGNLSEAFTMINPYHTLEGVDLRTDIAKMLMTRAILNKGGK